MNIAVDIRNLLAPQLTGVGVYTFKILNELMKNDKQNRYFLFYSGIGRNSKAILDLKKIAPDNFSFCHLKLPNKFLNLCWFLFNRPNLDNFFLKKHNVTIDRWWFPNLNFWFTEKPYILTVHDLSFKIMPQVYSWKMLIWHHLLGAGKKFRNAEKLVAVSENTKRDLITYFKINPDKIKVIPLGVTVLETTPEEIQAVKTKYNLPEKFFLFLGTREPRKNVEGLLSAYNNLNLEESLVLAGCEGWLGKNLKKSLKKSPKIDKIYIIDYPSDKEKQVLYHLATAFVWPSFYEGFGLPIIEAFACGAPVITSFGSSLPEVTDGTALLIDPYNLNDLERAMIELSENNLLREQLREKGLERAKDFSWEKTAEEMLKQF